jgi:hypothetical protein
MLIGNPRRFTVVGKLVCGVMIVVAVGLVGVPIGIISSGMRSTPLVANVEGKRAAQDLGSE